MSKLSRLLDETVLKKKFDEKKSEAEKIFSDEDKLRTFMDKVKEKGSKVPIIGPYLEEIPLLGNMILDFKNKKYSKIPRSSIVSIVAALLYFLSPIDVIPDFIFSFGLLDDAFVIKLALDGIRYDIQEYKEWKEGTEAEASEGEDLRTDDNANYVQASHPTEENADEKEYEHVLKDESIQEQNGVLQGSMIQGSMLQGEIVYEV